MLQPRWKKILRDLAYNRMRTVLVVTSIAIGVFAFGTIIAGLIVVQRELDSAYIGTNPASATVTTSAFDETLVDGVAKSYRVAQAQGRRAVTARIQIKARRCGKTRYFICSLMMVILRSISCGLEQGAWRPHAAYGTH
jgi:putative ABC transport system permease protein